MRLRLGIISKDSGYVDSLSSVLRDLYADDFEIFIYSSLDDVMESLDMIAVDEGEYKEKFSFSCKLTVVLSNRADVNELKGCRAIYKYQRISKIASELLFEFSKADQRVVSYKRGKANITCIWSPSGGIGKTALSVALAVKKARDKKRVLYMNLEIFSSTEVYFKESGRSISDALLGGVKNIQAFIKGLNIDPQTGVKYFSASNNYDDMNVLDREDIRMILDAVVLEADEVIIDLQSGVDEKTRSSFELSDRILVVDDGSVTSTHKLSQFISQNDLYQNYRNKMTLVLNKGASKRSEGFTDVLSIPIIHEDNEMLRALSMIRYFS